MKKIISKIKNGGFIMMKKMISAAMAAIIISASVVSATGNAMYISSEKNTSDYERMIEYRTNNCTNILEAAEYHNKRVGSDKERPVTNVWVRNGNETMYDEYIVQIEPIDGLGLAFEGDAPTSEELNALIRDKFEVSDDSVIAYNGNPTHLENGINTSYLSIKFFSTSHQANIELANSIVAYLKDNYTVKHSEGHFNAVELCELHIDWSVFLPVDKLTDEAIEEINTALSANGYKGHFNSETKYMVFDEDITQIEKYQLWNYLNSNYDLDIEWYGLAESTSVGGVSVDFLADGVKGDANLDGKATVADAVAILQHIANRDKYGLKAQGLINADVDGVEGVTANDALVLQQWDAGIR